MEAMTMEDDLERYFFQVFNRMMSVLNSGAMGVKISIDSDGNVKIDPIRPRKRKIYVPFEVIDAGEEYVVTLDVRNLPRRSTVLRVTPGGLYVSTPRGERFIYFEEQVNPKTVKMEERNGIVEITVKKGRGEGEKVIRFPR